ncbi:ABC transporter substrate-binding protein [Pseudoalteromonas luteoviolacea]|uniref:ABC transporter substrate-binding protein n=1 Tax=Pseudoalteromonas luteoviolacea TaxID=43657 RepID=UPI001F24403D|nr:ABC transporter substrate-binding protein [Pseudoalteromonas luteoviolacea]MCF6439833.1 ABC transporter substrate-binding protein [Pseudoalteromonas luteoviolacea]
MFKYCCAVLFVVLSTCLFAKEKSLPELHIYHDSDYSTHRQSAVAIKMGFLTALDEVDNQAQGFKIKLLSRDHRGNSNRSFLNFKRFLKDPSGLFVLGGLHSPPYIKYREFINTNQIPLLVPWAAGGPITRYDEGENWVFRLSVDDTKAGIKLVEFANQRACKNPHLFLERTPWGKSNYKSIGKALGNPEATVTWFDWGMKESSAKIHIREMVAKDSDCILFVGNAIEGKQLVSAMADYPKEQRIPIISHWGITGGDFFQQAKVDLASGIDLHFIQSCFSFQQRPLSGQAGKVWNNAKRMFSDEFAERDFLFAPTGFIHGYDLAKVALAAIEQIKLTGDMSKDRAAFRSALEQLDKPVKGLIKTYQNPYSKWSKQNPDAHEALGIGDLCMAYFESNGSTKVLVGNS